MIGPASTSWRRKFGDVDLARLPKELTSQGVVESRLKEIQSCLECEAPLAVIFLVGSTLEGLLSELAIAHASTYVARPEAPKVKGASNRWLHGRCPSSLRCRTRSGSWAKTWPSTRTRYGTSATTSTRGNSSRSSSSPAWTPLRSQTMCSERHSQTSVGSESTRHRGASEGGPLLGRPRGADCELERGQCARGCSGDTGGQGALTR